LHNLSCFDVLLPLGPVRAKEIGRRQPEYSQRRSWPLEDKNQYICRYMAPRRFQRSHVRHTRWPEGVDESEMEGGSLPANLLTILVRGLLDRDSQASGDRKAEIFRKQTMTMFWTAEQIVPTGGERNSIDAIDPPGLSGF
jgi:hypothetical protein